MKVLLVVDVQNDFCPGGSLAVPEGNQIVPIVNALMRNGGYDAVVASKDWHPLDHVSFADNHKGRALGEVVSTKNGAQMLWPAHCMQNTRGAEFHPKLDTNRIQFVVHKGTRIDMDSYSAFFDNGGVRSTGLVEYLKGRLAGAGQTLRNIDLHVCGLATDYCVKATAIDAARLGIKTSVLVDACRAVNINPDDNVKTLRELSRLGVRIKSSQMVLNPRRQRVVERGVALAA